MKNVKSGHSKPVVCLDAGHYGKYNRSPAVKSYYESDMNWKLHLLLKGALERYGIQVKTTRGDKDKDLGVYERGAASKGCDLFLSIHSNAVGGGVNESVDYAAVYHLTEDAGTEVDDQSKELAKLLAPVIADTMEVKQGGKVLARKAATDKNHDGVLNDNYYGVLNGARQAATPGLILEHSFHTNTRSTKWLMDEKNLQKLAKAEAQVIARWFDVSEKKAEKAGLCSLKLEILRKGNKGDAVTAMQMLLIGYGFGCGTAGADGAFGTATDRAVRAYQKANDLAVDGVVGAATWRCLLGA